MTCHSKIPAIDPNRIRYVVTCDYDSGAATAERVPSDEDRETTIHDIRCGELPNVIEVIEIEYVHHGLRGTMNARIVTEEIMRAAGRWEDHYEPVTAADRQAWNFDHMRGLRNA